MASSSSSSSSSLKKYKKLKYLGKGSYGAAILVELRSNPAQKFVVKEIVIGHLKPPEQAAARKEAEVLHQMNHSNITLYIESFVEASKLHIVMEHADGGDLTAAVGKRRGSGHRWGEDEVMRIFVQICLALKHVHGANILHRDLKSQNVFLTNKGIVKLGDFGIAKVLDSTEDQARTQIGTPYYLSPEICESKPYGRKSDIWSLGVILYELLALEMPFQAQSLPALVHRICTTEPAYAKLAPAYSAPVLALLQAMLHKDPDRRPDIAEVVRMDVIRTHISKLLSYTLKAGEGGAAAAAAPAPAPAPAGGRPSQPPLPRADDKRGAHDLSVEEEDAEEADRKIERARRLQAERERDSEARDAQARRAAEREAQRESERDKLRKFRHDMLLQVRRVACLDAPQAPHIQALQPSPPPFATTCCSGAGTTVAGRRTTMTATLSSPAAAMSTGSRGYPRSRVTAQRRPLPAGAAATGATTPRWTSPRARPAPTCGGRAASRPMTARSRQAPAPAMALATRHLTLPPPGCRRQGATPAAAT